MDCSLIKIGGSMMDNPLELASLAECLAALKRSGRSLILAHGGGKEISRNLELLQESAQFIDGLRFTSERALAMVEMTLSASVNKNLVRLLNKHLAQAVGISGVDGPTLICRALGERWGRVGEIESVDSNLVLQLLQGGFLPVLSPLSVDKQQNAFNVNADEAAQALAVALQVKRLIFISDVDGVKNSQGETYKSLRSNEAKALIDIGIATGGMVPKLKSCLSALGQGVTAVHICAWKNMQALEAHLLGEPKDGTIIVNERGV